MTFSVRAAARTVALAAVVVGVPAGATGRGQLADPLPAAPVDALQPSDVLDLYPPVTPRGRGERRLAIVGLAAPRLLESVAAYRSATGLQACATCVTVHPVVAAPRAGEEPLADLVRSAEASVEPVRAAIQGIAAVEAAVASCPTCRVHYIHAASSSAVDLGMAFVYAVRELRTRLVVSLVPSASAGDEADATIYRQFYAVRGMTHLAAAGDQGAADLPRLPAAGPNVLAVGGTTVRPGPAGWTSTGWHNTIAGCATAFARPAWQAGVPTECAGRAANDLSAAANPDVWPLAVVHDTGAAVVWRTAGGTSVAAALLGGWAAESGLAGSLTPESLYANRHLLRDVTAGPSNRCLTAAPCVETPPQLQVCGTDRQCRPEPGWDGPTGLGTPVPRGPRTTFAPAAGAPPATITREARGKYVGGNAAGYSLTWNGPDGYYSFGGDLAFPISSPKTDRFVVVQSVDRIAPAVSLRMSFADKDGVLLAGTAREGICGAVGKTRVPARAAMLEIEVGVMGCGAAVPATTGEVVVTFTNR